MLLSQLLLLSALLLELASMPFYELNLILRPIPKKEIVECLKRTANLIWKEDGVLRRIEFLGFQKLPFEARGEEEIRYKEGNYFLYHISLPQLKLRAIRPELKLDRDILRAMLFNANESLVPDDYECTLEEELRPPFYRESVQPLISDKNVLATARRVHNIQNQKVKLIGLSTAPS